ncbi:hypothetical protein ACFFSY_09905 [Paenibacillus aurantiacus]|uniref:CopG family transcriptional regulator n=1 Tax=Paenibacillus aurantiacus TaxID=1936118 RepID=A0ABV5KLW7_9BACL
MADQDPRLGIPRNDGQLSIVFNKGGARTGAGRKRLGITKKTSITLPEDIWRRLEAYCTEHGTTQSEALRTIITGYFSD